MSGTSKISATSLGSAVARANCAQADEGVTKFRCCGCGGPEAAEYFYLIRRDPDLFVSFAQGGKLPSSGSARIEPAAGKGDLTPMAAEPIGSPRIEKGSGLLLALDQGH